VRQAAIEALGEAIPFSPDINQVWIDLSIFLLDDDWIIRGRTIEAIGKAFSYLPDKNLAWNAIISMAYDPDKYVRWKIA
jgi:HEAT repeat protein